MTGPVNRELLLGQWLHSRDEDTDETKVYRRPAHFSRGGSRGASRVTPSGYEFSSDGSLRRVKPGPTDVSHVTSGAWRIENRVDEVDAARVQIEVNGKPEVLDIQSLEPDRLIIKRSTDVG